MGAGVQAKLLVPPLAVLLYVLGFTQFSNAESKMPHFYNLYPRGRKAVVSLGTGMPCVANCTLPGSGWYPSSRSLASLAELFHHRLWTAAFPHTLPMINERICFSATVAWCGVSRSACSRQ